MYVNFRCRKCGQYVVVGPLNAVTATDTTQASSDLIDHARKAQSAHAKTHPDCVDDRYVFYDMIQLSDNMLDSTSDIVDMR